MLLGLAAIAVCFVYTGRSISIVSDRLPVYAERAEIWDERNAQIILAREQGITEIDVRGIDSLPVGGMKDLKPNPNDWVNVCAARFYSVALIRAVLPGP